MAEIFVSYSSKDRDRIGQLVGHLEASGLSIWWDKELRGGSMFSKEIEAELNQAKAVLVAWTASSIDSHWVADEAELALRTRKLVPIRLDDIEPPMGFRQVHTLDFSDWKGEAGFAEIPTLLRAISHHTGAESVATVPASSAPAKADVPEASIAVLPFINRSSDPEQEFFSDGIAEEMLNLLGKIGEVQVAARSSSFQFSETDKLVDEVAELVGVAHILEGGVRKSGNRVRITAQLIKAATKFQLWSETYDRTLDDVFAIQDEISAAIVDALKEHLLSDVILPEASRSENPAAFEHYLLGQHLAHTRKREKLEESRQHYERAIECDPEYAPAYARLSMAWLL